MDILDDGHGNLWEAACPECRGRMQIMRPGEVQCPNEPHKGEADMAMLSSYGSPLNIGHRLLEEYGLFGDEAAVYVQEKIDGSQISFGVVDGQLMVRSRRTDLMASPTGMFDKAIATITDLFNTGDLTPGYIYRGEYLLRPKHNTLAYERVPWGHIILFDIEISEGHFVRPAELDLMAEDLGLEVVPHLATLTYLDMEQLKAMLDTTSCLGGTKIEGVVLKNYDRIGQDKKLLMGKLVSEEFREVHKADWKSRNPNRSDVVEGISARYGTQRRWQKAAQHLAEAGVLVNAPQDIPLLMREITEDVLKECGEAIKDELFKHHWKAIARGLTRGMPEWYKASLSGDLPPEPDAAVLAAVMADAGTASMEELEAASDVLDRITR